MSNPAKPERLEVQGARLALECLIEQGRDVLALLTVIRDRYDDSDPTMTRLIEMAWDRMGEVESKRTLGDFFGVDMFAMADESPT